MIIKPGPHSLFGSRWVDPGVGMSLLALLRDSISVPCDSDRIVLPVDIIAHYLPRYLRFEEQLPGMIYVFGGRCSKVLEPQHYLATAEVYDPFRNEWFALPSMATRRVGAASIELNGMVYVVGGYCLHPDKPLSSCEVFNPRTGCWSSTADMKQARFGHAIASVGNRYLFVVGGDCRRTLVTQIERYDSVSDIWEVVSQLPTPVAGGRMLEKGGNLFLVGGDIGSQPLAFTNIVRSFDPLTLQWKSMPFGLETGRSACAVCWFGEGSDSLAVIGGYAAQDDTFHELKSGEIINPSTGERRELPPLPEARAGCRAVHVGKKIFVVGGESPPPTTPATQPERRPPPEMTLDGMVSAIVSGAYGPQARQALVTGVIDRVGGNQYDAGNMLNAYIAAAVPIRGRLLHSSTLAFDTDKWEWVADMPAMAQPRTAAAVCSGSGFPRSFGPTWDSKLCWRPDTARRSFTAA